MRGPRWDGCSTLSSFSTGWRSARGEFRRREVDWPGTPRLRVQTNRHASIVTREVAVPSFVAGEEGAHATIVKIDQGFPLVGRVVVRDGNEAKPPSDTLTLFDEPVAPEVAAAACGFRERLPEKRKHLSFRHSRLDASDMPVGIVEAVYGFEGIIFMGARRQWRQQKQRQQGEKTRRSLS